VDIFTKDDKDDKDVDDKGKPSQKPSAGYNPPSSGHSPPTPAPTPAPTPKYTTKAPTPAPTPGPLNKKSVFRDLRAIVKSGKFDVFFNLCDGAKDEDRAGEEVASSKN
jgi:hypothetical protein